MFRSIIGLPWVVLLLGAVSAGTVQAANAPSSSEAETLVNSYIASLSAGDTGGIKSVIGGTLIARSKRSLDTGEKYGAFLRKNYTGVQMNVISVVRSGDQYLVSVLFLYPAGDTETIIFTVGDENGQTRIIDEKL